MLKLILIRHFATEGNLQKRYIGTTEEEICEIGKQMLTHNCYPYVDAVVTSPMIRCVQTAKLIYPDHIPQIYKDFRECDFGDFENKNHRELSNDPSYQTWINSNGTLPFPGGEDPEHFKARCIRAFDEMINHCLKNKYESIAVVAHGGTIMSILDQYSYPHEDYFHWQVENGNGYHAEIKDHDRRLRNLCIIHS